MSQQLPWLERWLSHPDCGWSTFFYVSLFPLSSASYAIPRLLRIIVFDVNSRVSVGVEGCKSFSCLLKRTVKFRGASLASGLRQWISDSIY
jgi:hypothetical protein